MKGLLSIAAFDREGHKSNLYHAAVLLIMLNGLCFFFFSFFLNSPSPKTLKTSVHFTVSQPAVILIKIIYYNLGDKTASLCKVFFLDLYNVICKF